MEAAPFAGSKCAAMLCAGAVFAMAATGPALAEVSRVVVQDFGPDGDLRRAPVHLGHRRHGGNRRQGRWHRPGTTASPCPSCIPIAIRTALASSTRQLGGFLVYLDETAPMGKRKIYYVGDVIFSDYLRRQGFVYMSVQWARMVTEELGSDYGVIEDGRDGYEIVKDAARFLRVRTGSRATWPPDRRRSTM